MAIIFMDGFEHYGIGNASQLNMLDNAYAAMSTEPEVSESQARTGNRSLVFTATSGQFIRRVFPAAAGEVFVGFVFYAASLPDSTSRVSMCALLDSSNADLLSVVPLPDGSIAVRNGGLGAANVAVTAGPVIGASAWNHIEVRAVRATGTVQVKVNGVQVLTTTGFTFGADFAQWALEGNGSGAGALTYYVDDLIVNNASGSYNTTWKGDLRVATLFPNAVGTPNGWTKFGTAKFGNGVFAAQDSFVSYADVAGFAIGSGDFAVEGFWRIEETPASGQQTLCGQYDSGNNQRSWKLYRDFGDSGAIKFDISTDGAAGTIVNVLRWLDYDFEIGRYYHIAVARVSGTTRLFIDGEMQGVGVADANTYHNSTSELWVGAQQNRTFSTNVSGVSSEWTLDEFRFTVGTGRYSANFAPPSAAFPRSAPGDPDFADVQLLLGFEGVYTDASSNAQSEDTIGVSNGGPALLDTVTDAAGKWSVVDDPTPNDTTYIAADFLFATGTLTLTALPTAAETVTVGATTYTFVAALTGADDVLIGADADASLDNLTAAINGGAGEGTVYGTGTVANTSAAAEALGGSQMRATAAAQGTAGNSVATTETLTAGSWTGATLSGGADIPAAQEFTFTPLPIDTTAVKGIQLYHRSRKTDSAACNVQASFHVGASSADGADRPITTAFAYYADVFEEDPDTTAGLTVNSISAGAFQLDRTA